MPMDSSLAARVLATWFGCGKSPVAPGTVGTLGAIPLHLALRALGPIPYAAAVVAVTAVGTWAAQRESERLGVDDPQSVVIDEVAGVLVALLLARGSLRGELLAVGLFRVFDIWKPGLVDRAQELEPKGVGIMADDIAAGVLAGLLARWITR
jgi:phosphatidylglycerophosphatase A